MRVIMLSRFVAALGVLVTSVACNEDSLSPTPQPTPLPPAETGMTVVPRTATIRAGQFVGLEARIVDEFGDELGGAFAWSSSNDAVATVSDNGVVYGRSEGKVVITASALGKRQSSTISVVGRQGKPDSRHSDPLLLRRLDR